MADEPLKNTESSESTTIITSAGKPGFLEIAVEAIAFNKLLLIGLMIVLMADVAACFWLASHPVVDAKTVEFVLSMFKDVSLIIVGAVAGLLQGKKEG